MNRDDFAYDPAVTVEPMFRVSCDNCIDWQRSSLVEIGAKALADAHRRWHHAILEALEGVGECSSCGTKDSAPELSKGLHGGLPYLYCGTCRADW